MSVDIEKLRKTPFMRVVLAENNEKVLAEGEAKGEAKAVLRLLDRRSVPVTDQDRERIRTCTDLAQLDAWFDAALDATSSADLFQ